MVCAMGLNGVAPACADGVARVTDDRVGFAVNKGAWSMEGWVLLFSNADSHRLSRVIVRGW